MTRLIGYGTKDGLKQFEHSNPFWMLESPVGVFFVHNNGAVERDSGWSNKKGRKYIQENIDKGIWKVVWTDQVENNRENREKLAQVVCETLPFDEKEKIVVEHLAAQYCQDEIFRSDIKEYDFHG